MGKPEDSLKQKVMTLTDEFLKKNDRIFDEMEASYQDQIARLKARHEETLRALTGALEKLANAKGVPDSPEKQQALYLARLHRADD